ncbi:MAG: hypothetical protein ACM3X8_07580, partial [Methanomicrobiales archaeon]
YLYRVIVGCLLILWGVAEILLNPSGISILPTALLAAGLAFFLVGIIRWRKFGNAPEQDERSRKIGSWGISYSWIVSLIFMTALFWLDYLRVVSLTIETALGSSILVMIFSAVAFQMYLFRKGDVE